jgi:hypothetical protein
MKKKKKAKRKTLNVKNNEKIRQNKKESKKKEKTNKQPIKKNLFYSNKTKTLSTPLLMLFYIICITTNVLYFLCENLNTMFTVSVCIKRHKDI